MIKSILAIQDLGNELKKFLNTRDTLVLYDVSWSLRDELEKLFGVRSKFAAKCKCVLCQEYEFDHHELVIGRDFDIRVGTTLAEDYKAGERVSRIRCRPTRLLLCKRCKHKLCDYCFDERCNLWRFKEYMIEVQGCADDYPCCVGTVCGDRGCTYWAGGITHEEHCRRYGYRNDVAPEPLLSGNSIVVLDDDYQLRNVYWHASAAEETRQILQSDAARKQRELGELAKERSAAYAKRLAELRAARATKTSSRTKNHSTSGGCRGIWGRHAPRLNM